jgi:hypothetical protein
MEVPDWQVHEYNPIFTSCANPMHALREAVLVPPFRTEKALLEDTGSGNSEPRGSERGDRKMAGATTGNRFRWW